MFNTYSVPQKRERGRTRNEKLIVHVFSVISFVRFRCSTHDRKESSFHINELYAVYLRPACLRPFIYIYREEGGKTIECRSKSGFNPDIGPILELKCDEGDGEPPLSTIKRRSHTGVVKKRVASLDGYTCWCRGIYDAGGFTPRTTRFLRPLWETDCCDSLLAEIEVGGIERSNWGSSLVRFWYKWGLDRSRQVSANAHLRFVSMHVN